MHPAFSLPSVQLSFYLPLPFDRYEESQCVSCIIVYCCVIYVLYSFAVPPTIAPFKWPPIVAGHRTSKTCEVPTGDLPIRITWFWNGKVMSSARGVSVDSKDFQSYLTFSEVKPEHRGRYTCKAENKAGSVSFSEELVVNGMLVV